MLLQLNTIRFELNQSIILTLPRRLVAKVDPDDRESQVRTLEMMTRVCISLSLELHLAGRRCIWVAPWCGGTVRAGDVADHPNSLDGGLVLHVIASSDDDYGNHEDHDYHDDHDDHRGRYDHLNPI